MEIKNIEDSNFKEVIGAKLDKFNRENCKWILENTNENKTDIKYYNFAVYNNGEIIGGEAGIVLGNGTF